MKTNSVCWLCGEPGEAFGPYSEEDGLCWHCANGKPRMGWQDKRDLFFLLYLAFGLVCLGYLLGKIF